jgi:hypothetical protein
MSIKTIPVEEQPDDLIEDKELIQAMTFQKSWLAHPKIKAIVRLTGWDTPIKFGTNVTYRNLRHRPYYNWHAWMREQTADPVPEKPPKRRKSVRYHLYKEQDFKET